MKPTLIATIAISIMVLFITACQQEKQETKRMDQQNQVRITDIMQDSSIVNTIMDHIVSNGDTRTKMMHKIILHTKTDTGEMMQMFNTMAENKEMHAMMMKMMGSGVMIENGMMKRDMTRKVTR